MKVSVIIPSYNRLGILKTTIHSYMKQREVTEIIIIDDGSIQNYWDLERYDKVEVIKNEENQGLPNCRNQGIEYAKEQLIFMGEDDVWLKENHIRQLIKCMKKEKADIIAGRMITEEITTGKRLDGGDEKRYHDFPIDLNHAYKPESDEETLLLHACALFKKKVFANLKYDENIRGNHHREESDLYVSAKKMGFKSVLCPHTLSTHLK